MIGTRIQQRIDALGLSQSELARRTGLNQSTINGLVRGHQRSSVHLHRIARALETTPAFLEGDIDDPSENAPAPQSRPQVQYVMLQAVLPNEDALAAAFEGLLLASPRMPRDELARELAKRLPTLLRVAGGAIAAPASADPFVADEAEEAADDDRREPRRASRT